MARNRFKFFKPAYLMAGIFCLAAFSPERLQAQDHSSHTEHNQESSGHSGHQMDDAMYDALREKVPLYKEYSNARIDMSMVMMGPNYHAYVSSDGVSANAGVLVLAHGFGEVGDRVLKEKLEPMAGAFPTAIGFGMSMVQSSHIQEAVTRLTEAGAERIVIVPALSSPFNTQMRQWEYMFNIHDNAGYLETPRIQTSAEIVYAEPMSDDPLVAEMIIDHASELSTNPSNELVIIASHGPSHEEDNNATLDMLASLGDIVLKEGGYGEVKWISLQNDAPKAIKEANIEKLRAWVKAANDQGQDVLVVTNLLGTRTIQNQIRDSLEGLEFQFNAKGMSQHPNFVKWIQETVMSHM